jgi:hypothetical protein
MKARGLEGLGGELGGCAPQTPVSHPFALINSKTFLPPNSTEARHRWDAVMHAMIAII